MPRQPAFGRGRLPRCSLFTSFGTDQQMCPVLFFAGGLFLALLLCLPSCLTLDVGFFLAGLGRLGIVFLGDTCLFLVDTGGFLFVLLFLLSLTFEHLVGVLLLFLLLGVVFWCVLLVSRCFFFALAAVFIEICFFE